MLLENRVGVSNTFSRIKIEFEKEEEMIVLAILIVSFSRFSLLILSRYDRYNQSIMII